MNIYEMDDFTNVEVQDLVDVFGLKTKILQNTKIVVHGDCFLKYLLNDVQLKWAGDYQAFILKMTKVFSVLNQLNVEPIFVFEGCMDRQVNETTSLTMPVCLKAAFIDLLVSLGIKYTTAFMSARISSVSLATFLGCPLLASGADYIFMVSRKTISSTDTKSDLIYIPLELLDSESPVFGDNLESDATTPCVKVIYPNASKLHKVADIYRPLLALFLAKNEQFRINIPSSVCSESQSNLSLNNYQPILHCLINWLSSFQADSNEAFDQIFAANSAKSPSTILQHAMLSFVYDPHMDGRLVALKLRLNESSSEASDSNFMETPNTSLNSSDSQDKHCGIDFDVLPFSDDQSNNIMKFHWKPDFIISWPLPLINAYQNAKFSHSLLLPLYFDGGIQLLPVIQDSEIPISVYQFSLPVRAIAYQIMIGVEHELQKQSKLKGLNPNVVEYEWRDDKFFKRTIELAPLILNKNVKSVDQILTHQIGLSLPEQIPQPDWLLSLAFTLALWFQQVTQFINPSEKNFDDSTIGLTMCACAVANISNLDFIDDNLSAHYDRLADYMEEETAQFIERTSGGDLDSQIDQTNYRLHHFNAIQSIYLNLRSVVQILNSLLPEDKQSSSFSFLPPWLLFPSGRLFNCFAAHLDKQLPTIRYYQVINFWLPRLYRAKHKNTMLSPRLNGLADVFKRLVCIVSILCRSTIRCLSVKHTLTEIISDVNMKPDCSQNNGDKVSDEYFNKHPDSPWVRGCSLTKSSAKRHALSDCSNKNLF